VASNPQQKNFEVVSIALTGGKPSPKFSHAYQPEKSSHGDAASCSAPVPQIQILHHLTSPNFDLCDWTDGNLWKILHFTAFSASYFASEKPSHGNSSSSHSWRSRALPGFLLLGRLETGEMVPLGVVPHSCKHCR
jgi:hypothetical protein